MSNCGCEEVLKRLKRLLSIMVDDMNYMRDEHEQYISKRQNEFLINIYDEIRTWNYCNCDLAQRFRNIKTVVDNNHARYENKEAMMHELHDHYGFIKKEISNE